MTAAFHRILVSYDGSDPAGRALEFAIAMARAGSALDVVHFVDEIAVIADSATSAGLVDPAPTIAMLDRQCRALLDAVAARCREAKIEATTTLFHERPIFGISAAAEKNGDDLVVLGTHARSGLPRAFLGSTTEGVLRTSTVPILAVTAAMTPPAATYGYDPTQFADQMSEQAQDVIGRAQAHAGFSPGTSVSIVEGEPARTFIAEAQRTGAEAIVIGSHGRRGLQRLFLGSVAEYVIRHSPLPVFVLRSR